MHRASFIIFFFAEDHPSRLSDTEYQGNEES
jgi:hypothetical protein